MAEISPSELLVIFNERDKHTQEKLVEMVQTQKETSVAINKICDHITTSEADRKYDAEFKKETREHIKFAEPILFKARDHQAIRNRMFILVASIFVAGIFTAVVSFK